MNKKGFLLLDSLIVLFIITSISIMIIDVYKIKESSTKTIDNYIKRQDKYIEDVFISNYVEVRHVEN